MFDLDRWGEIFQSINKNKLRTTLGAFTVALGIFIFTVLFGMGNGLKNTFDEFFSDDATNTILYGREQHLRLTKDSRKDEEFNSRTKTSSC